MMHVCNYCEYRPARYQALTELVAWMYLCQECLDLQYPEGNYLRGQYLPPLGVQLPLPPGTERIESGTIQFGEDWPGLFLRGKHAGVYANSLSILLDAIKHLDPPPVDTIFPEKILRGLLDDLQSTNVASGAPCLRLKPIEQCKEELKGT